VPGATIAIENPAGHVVGRPVTDAHGRFELHLPPGQYRLVPQPVDGITGKAAPRDVTLGPSGAGPITIEYDTGIR
jgi:hypothetical protein